MKKAVLAMAAVAAFTAPALAADMAAKAPLRAAPVAYAPSWTGCYVGGGGGYGMWNQENVGHVDPFTITPVAVAPETVLTEATIIRSVAPQGPLTTRTRITDTVTSGGRGYFGTVQGGCDYQFQAAGWNLVVGAFGDYDFADIHGHHAFAALPIVANERLSSQWAVGGRIGAVVLPSLLVYFSGGYTEATFDRQDFTNLFGPPFGVSVGAFLDKRTYKGWFLGAGDEYALSFLPGLFWKTEYRVSEFNRESNSLFRTSTGLPTIYSEDSKKWVQTVRSELVYRFNWSGVGAPVAARY
jgi:outer membrane immunogenic protein